MPATPAHPAEFASVSDVTERFAAQGYIADTAGSPRPCSC
ncbi:hypothetical protein SANTM175S_00757 [Streptomyces antimycoticus]